jgi:hypothetical protein
MKKVLFIICLLGCSSPSDFVIGANNAEDSATQDQLAEGSATDSVSTKETDPTVDTGSVVADAEVTDTAVSSTDTALPPGTCKINADCPGARDICYLGVCKCVGMAQETLRTMGLCGSSVDDGCGKKISIGNLCLIKGEACGGGTFKNPKSAIGDGNWDLLTSGKPGICGGSCQYAGYMGSQFKSTDVTCPDSMLDIYRCSGSTASVVLSLTKCKLPTTTSLIYTDKLLCCPNDVVKSPWTVVE